MASKVLVASWSDGVFVLTDSEREHELAGHPVRGLSADGRGGTLAIVDGHTLRRRAADGAWTKLADADCELSCCVVSNGAIYVGTEDARLFCLDSDELVQLPGFDRVQGRETWWAGQMLVDGKLLGPPLGIRSLSATADGALLANVHVGGIPRSLDAGIRWHPTIEVASDVHEVRAHPSRAGIVMAAAAVGLCSSGDGGATWRVEQAGLHAPYCSALAFVDDDVLVSAAEHHFSDKGRIYRRKITGDPALSAVLDGLPEWTDGIVDTHCIAVSGSRVAFVDHGGHVYASIDAGRTWSRMASDLPSPSSVHIV
jgi:hypothetical protein